MMGKLRDEKFSAGAFCYLQEIFVEICALQHEQNHDQAPHEIKGKKSLVRGLRRHGYTVPDHLLRCAK